MSISAMKQALNALEVLLRDYGAVHDAGDLEMQPALHQAHVAVEKLRQAIAEAEKQGRPVNPLTWEFESLGHAMLGEGKPFYRSGKKISLSAMRSGEKFILVRTGQIYSIKDNGSVWNETENRPSRLHKNCQVEPLYTAPVHASDISQERVDETAKREHEFEEMVKRGTKAWADTPDDWVDELRGGVEKREWVGLTDEEVKKIVDLNTEDDYGYDIWCNGRAVARDVEAKLKEKNT
jgi:hypothetical protein